MVWNLQDLQAQIDADNIEAPQLLPGINLASDLEERRKNRRLYKPELDALKDDEEIDTAKAFKNHAEKAK